MNIIATLTLSVILVAFPGCASSPRYVPQTHPLEAGSLPAPNAALDVPHLSSCTDSPDHTLHLNTNYPVTVLVHGCNASAGRFRSLAQLYAFHGQQAVCFSYNDRNSLIVSSGQLIAALDELSGNMRNRTLTLLGHSMGGLVARKALEQDRAGAWRRNDAKIILATISAPLAGIRSANICGSQIARWLSVGAVPVICWFVTGNNWNEVNASSDFIRNPRPLLASVQRYLKVVTDERDSCRLRSPNGTCLKSDFTFSLAEQYNPAIDNYPQLVNVQVTAGHVAIVGDKEVVPRQLLEILQQQGLLAETPAKRRAALDRLLAALYGE